MNCCRVCRRDSPISPSPTWPSPRSGKRRSIFSIPVYQNISEVVVASTEAPTVVTLKELSGKSVVVRPSSSYFESLQALNLQLLKSHRLPVNIVLAEEHLETKTCSTWSMPA